MDGQSGTHKILWWYATRKLKHENDRKTQQETKKNNINWAKVQKHREADAMQLPQYSNFIVSYIYCNKMFIVLYFCSFVEA